MKRSNKIFIAMCVATVCVVPAVVLAYREGPPVRHSGVPGEANCTACHIGSPVNSSGNVALTFSGGTTYTPGQKQTITITITDTGTPARGAYGFQLTARLASNLLRGQAGTFSNLSGATQVLCGNDNPRPAGGCAASDPLEFIEHTTQGVNATGRFEVEWTAPATDVGNIRFFVAGNAANNSRTESGDRIYTADATLTPAAAGGPRPTISQGGVGDAFTGQAGTAAGTWTAIYGQNLSPTTRQWNDSDFREGRLPTALDGVSVRINNRPAYVYFISPGQVNVLAPADTAEGDVQVVVTSPGGESAPVTTRKSRILPAFYAPFGEGGRLFVTVIENSSGAILGKPGVEPRSTRAVRPGDVIQLYATGFGATNPEINPEQQAFAPAPIVGTPSIRINDVPVEYFGGVLRQSGLYQLNIRVPDSLANGDHRIIAEMDGVRSSDNVFINVQR